MRVVSPSILNRTQAQDVVHLTIDLEDNQAVAGQAELAEEAEEVAAEATNRAKQQHHPVRKRKSILLIKERMKEYTPEWAEKISSVPAETIRLTSREFVEPIRQSRSSPSRPPSPSPGEPTQPA